MNMLDLAETELMRGGLRRYWGRTTTTTIEDEEPDVSISSEVAPECVSGHLFIALMPQNVLRPISPNFGKILVFQSAPQEVVLVGTGTATLFGVGNPVTTSNLLSSLHAEHAEHAQHARLLRPVANYEEEVLNWDAAIAVAPKRPSGTVSVTLKYAGRGSPTPMEDPWD